MFHKRDCLIKWNLSFAKPKVPSHQSSSLPEGPTQATDGGRNSRSRVCQLDWTLCMFCQKKKHRGAKDVCNICTFAACRSIQNAAELRGDEGMLI